MTGETVSSNTSGQWDVLSSESDAIWEAKQAREIQKDLGDRIKTLADKNEKISQKEFERWEEEYDEQYSLADDRLHEEGADFTKYCDVMVNTVAYPGSGRENDLKGTVEAYAGNYYFDRKQALENAIKESDKTEKEKEKDISALDNFVSAVYTHIDYKYATQDEQRDYGIERFDRDRTRAHNEAMKQLNNINDLAREYGTKPFTVRNFHPSDTVSKNRQTQAESTIFRYDRNIVEEYYAYAFASKVSRAEAQMKHRMEHGIY